MQLTRSCLPVSPAVTMDMSAAAATATGAAAGTRTPLYNLALRLPEEGVTVISGLNEFYAIWILIGPERDDDWNLWIQAISRDCSEGGGGDEWVVRHTEWWWGEYDDEWLTYY